MKRGRRGAAKNSHLGVNTRNASHVTVGVKEGEESKARGRGEGGGGIGGGGAGGHDRERGDEALQA